MGYTKLFNEILLSTVWQEADYVRLVWITLLAMKDDRHEVMSSEVGISKMANVELELVKKALLVLESPDIHSRSTEFEGRRIEKIDGGWVILNGEKYRRKMSREQRKDYMREYMRDYQKKKPQKEKKPTQLDDSFEQIWAIYPARNGHKPNKKQAMIEWSKLSESEQNTALQNLPKHIQHRETCVAQNRFFPEFPDCFRWLRNKKFNDEFSEVKKPLTPLEIESQRLREKYKNEGINQ